MYLTVTPSKIVLTRTAGPARVRTGVSCCRKRWRSLEKEEPKMRIGRMTVRMASGERLIQRSEEALKISGPLRLTSV